MDLTHLILFIIGSLLFLLISISYILRFWKNFKDRKKRERSILRFSSLLALIAIPIFLVQCFVDESKYSVIHHEVQNEETLRSSKLSDTLPLPEERIDGYAIHKDLDWHFRSVLRFKKSMEQRSRHVNYHPSDFINEDWSQFLFNKYEAYSSSKDSTIRNIGHLFLALHGTHLRWNPSLVNYHITSVTDTSMKFFSYTKGLIAFSKRDWDNLPIAEKYLTVSIQKGEAVAESYRTLSFLYHYYRQEQKLKELVYNDSTSRYVPSNLDRTVKFKEGDFGGYWRNIWNYFSSQLTVSSFTSAFILLALWFYFIRKNDIFEKEKWHHLLITLVLSFLCMQLLYPIHDFAWSYLEYYSSDHPAAHFWYITTMTGMVEEFVKILPVLIILKFSKAINEPFDYILYPCVAALGFAFIENIEYFGSNLGNISARGVICCTGHMFWSATIGYAMMLAKYRGYNKYLLFGMGFFAASMLHGFYDFWIMDRWAIDYYWMSYVTVIIGVQLWVLYANNALNISNFFSKHIQFDSHSMRFTLAFIFTAIGMVGYVTISLNKGRLLGNEYLLQATVELLFFVCLMICSLGSFQIIRRYISPLRLSLFPFTGVSKIWTNASGKQIQMKTSRRFHLSTDELENPTILNQEVILNDQVLLNNANPGYIGQLNQTLQVKHYRSDQVLIVPEWEHKVPWSKKRTLVRIFLVPNDDVFDQQFLNTSDFKLIGRLFTTGLENDVEI